MGISSEHFNMASSSVDQHYVTAWREAALDACGDGGQTSHHWTDDGPENTKVEHEIQHYQADQYQRALPLEPGVGLNTVPGKETGQYP